jgi:CheY-like chemotaxis protein
LIITDVHLTDGTGYDILRHVRSIQRLNTKPVVVLSSSADPKEREVAFELGALAVLARPIEPELLIAEIAGALNSAQAKEYGTYPHR